MIHPQHTKNEKYKEKHTLHTDVQTLLLLFFIVVTVVSYNKAFFVARIFRLKKST